MDSVFVSGALVVAAYFIGNVSPAILISRMKGRDIRTSGSGNAGATNMLRTYGRGAAVATLAIDRLKGSLAVWLGAALGGAHVSYLCAVAVIAGHIWPAFYGFRGGKGIATGLGLLLAVSPVVGLLTAVIAFSTIGLTKRVSAGSVTAAACVPLLVRRFVPAFFPYVLLIVAWIIWKHRENIGRLIRGEESKIKL